MDTNFDIDRFFHPPDEFGIVSFYWWVGEKLEKDRLLWQLDQLSDMDICGLQLNYCHRDTGGKIYGQPFESDPKQFTEEWWELFHWFLEEAEKRHISVSLSDYTLGTAGQGYYADEILTEHPDLRGRELTCKTASLLPGESFTAPPDPNRVSLYAFSDGGDPTPVPRDVPFHAARPCTVADVSYRVEPYSIDPMHPASGAQVVEKFFQRFEDRNPGKAGKALNFFFSDELSFGVRGNLWDDGFAEAFQARKGYDIRPYLYGLFADIGPITQKIRLDYYDVIVSLEEKNYFQPIYNWHESRGMTYGCDHGGRGYDVTEFGDYFRTQKYNQGPGNDQPNLSSDIIKNKVASSISHLYNRPRTWLEGFYGSGWGTSSAEVLDAVCRNFAMGHNLLSLHGLYYTTLGGFWEWAPPCNHFRMPYWRQMKKLTSSVKRMAYLNTRGVHQCDVAILYPVAAVEGGLDGERAVEAAFGLGRYLYEQGVDFDYIDYESLCRAEARDGKLSVAGKCYRALVVPSMKTIRFCCLEKLEAFKASGGLAVCLGDRPMASDRAGREDPVLNDLAARLFPQTLPGPQAVLDTLDAAFERDFRVLDSEDRPYFQHRQTDRGELYFLYGLPAGRDCFFRAKGTPLLLDPLDAKIYRLPAGREEGEGTVLPLPLDKTRPQLILFAADAGGYPRFPACKVEKTIPLAGKWQCDLLPTMDNTYGDFAQPPTAGKIGPQIRRPLLNGQVSTIGFAPYMRVTGPVDPAELTEEDERALMTAPEKAAVPFHDYLFSLRYGREDDPGHQGWHGLKGQVTDEFLTFGRQVDRHQQYDYEEELPGGVYFVYTYVYVPRSQRAEILTGSLGPAKLFVNGCPAGKFGDLKPGYNLVAAKFTGTGRTYLILQKEHPAPFRQTVPLAMTWYKNPNILPMDSDKGRRKNNTVTFSTPPACHTFRLEAAGILEARFDGLPADCRRLQGNRYEIHAPRKRPGSQKVELTLSAHEGEPAAAALLSFVDCLCDTGEIETGDWGETDGLRFYSGGLRYGKQVELPALKQGERALLHLGEVSAAASVEVNGRPAGDLVAPPFRLDITPYVEAGENILSVTVYNTLYNHYRTIPTKYNGRAQKSGLLGPVQIEICKGEED